LEQAKAYAPKVITLLQRLVETGQVEVLAETYHHSLASLYSPEEFKHQVELHQKTIEQTFAVTPEVFRNTELIYSNEIGQMVEDMGYIGCLTEAVDRYLAGQKRTQLFRGKTQNHLPLLLKHAQLSDDIAFRFSDKSWVSYPLSADTFLHWINEYTHDDIINLFMDFETFGEHQWEATGIFEFFQIFVEHSLKFEKNKFVTPSQIFKSQENINDAPLYDVPYPISWADIDRDLTAWVDNELQKDTLKKLYELEKIIVSQKNQELQEDWRKLQTSDHFYYMCTKWAADGDVHAYFSPYESPYEAYRRFSIVLADLRERIL
jgi:alpha-amylase